MELKKNRDFVINRNDLTKTLLISVIGFGILIIFQITRNPAIHITMMWILTIIAIVMVDFDFYHPYFWFSLFFTLYSTANAILWNAGIRSGNYSKEQVLYPIIALVIVLLIIGPKRITKEKLENCPNIIRNNTIVKVIKILAVLTVIFSVILYMRGYSSKIQMKNQGDLIYRFGVQIVRFLTVFVLFYVGKMLATKERYSWKLIILCGMATLIFTLFTSERDVVFRYGLTIIMLLFAYDVVKKRHLLFVFPLAVLAMVISVIIKAFFLRGTLNTGTGNIIYDFLSSDFTAAGRNFQYLLDRPWTNGALGLKTFWTELLNPLLVGISKVNPDRWFNYEVHTGGYKGYAFTLVGTGYAVSGFFGIVLIFIVVGLLVKHFYRKSATNNYWMAAYIYLSSIVIFSFRQSLQTITGSLVKHILLSVIICMVLDRFKVTFKNRVIR